MSDETEEGKGEAAEEPAVEGQDAMADEWAAALEQQADAADGGGGDDWAAALAEQADEEETQKYESARFQNVEDEGQPVENEDVNLGVIMDIPVTIAMEIGRTKISIRNLLQLNQGSVVELDRVAGEPMDVMVNGTLIAHGEVVVVNEKFGIRLTDVVSPTERVKKLK